MHGKQSDEDSLDALEVLDLDEGLSEDGQLLPPPEMEPTSEDPSLSAVVTCPELEEPSNSGLSDGSLNINTKMTPEERALDDDTVNAVPPISSELHTCPAELLVAKLRKKESNKSDDAVEVKTSDYIVDGDDNKSQNSNPSADCINKKTDDDIVIIDDDDDDGKLQHREAKWSLVFLMFYQGS